MRTRHGEPRTDIIGTVPHPKGCATPSNYCSKFVFPGKNGRVRRPDTTFEYIIGILPHPKGCATLSYIWADADSAAHNNLN